MWGMVISSDLGQEPGAAGMAPSAGQHSAAAAAWASMGADGRRGAAHGRHPGAGGPCAAHTSCRLRHTKHQAGHGLPVEAWSGVCPGLRRPRYHHRLPLPHPSSSNQFAHHTQAHLSLPTDPLPCLPCPCALRPAPASACACARACPAGSDAQSIQPTLAYLRRSGIRAILDYAAEDDVDEPKSREEPNKSGEGGAASDIHTLCYASFTYYGCFALRRVFFRTG